MGWTMRWLWTLAAWLPFTAGDVMAVNRDGDLDDRFGSRGKVTLAFPGDLPMARGTLPDLVLLPDGRILVAAGITNAADNADFGVLRLQAAGSLDTSFGVSGGRRVGFDRAGSDLTDSLYGLAVQGDGRILLSGTVAGDDATGDDFGVARLTAAGQIDTTFGNAGKAVVAFNTGASSNRDDHGRRLVVQADGRIVMAGFAEHASGYHMAVARLTSNGQRDTSFDTDGRVLIDFGPDYLGSMAIQPRVLASGKLIIAGLVQHNHGFDFAVARLNADGSLDASFGDGGRAVFVFGLLDGPTDQAYDIVERPGGRVLACGQARVAWPDNNDMACVQFLDDGSIDPAFPPMLVSFDRGGDMSDIAARIAIDAHGRILLAGVAERADQNSDFAIARLLPSGELDPRFGVGGLRNHHSCLNICLPGQERDNQATGVALLPDGGILLAGGVDAGAAGYRIQVMRLIGDVLFSDDFQLD